MFAFFVGCIFKTDSFEDSFAVGHKKTRCQLQSYQVAAHREPPTTKTLLEP